MMNEFIKKDGNIIVNVDHAEAYIPASMFDNSERQSAIASYYGEGFSILGLFNIRLSNDPNQDDMSKLPLRTFNYPNMITTYPSSSADVVMSLTKDEEPIKYKVLRYVQGDIMMSDKMPKSGDNAVKFMHAIIDGKLPHTIPYNDILTAWLQNLESNSANPGVPYLYLQCIISEICRSRKNPSNQFRKVYGKDMTSNDYTTTNMRGTAAYSSVFASQIFEDMGRMLTTSVNMSRRKIPQSISPIEKVLYI